MGKSVSHTDSDQSSLAIHNSEVDVHKIFIVSTSRCEPCEKAKRFLRENGVPFDYIDIDTANEDEWDSALDIIGDNLPAHGVKMVFPLIILDGVTMIKGFSESRLREILNL